jgi:hypothetical protein
MVFWEKITENNAFLNLFVEEKLTKSLIEFTKRFYLPHMEYEESIAFVTGKMKKIILCILLGNFDWTNIKNKRKFQKMSKTFVICGSRVQKAGKFLWKSQFFWHIGNAQLMDYFTSFWAISIGQISKTKDNSKKRAKFSLFVAAESKKLENFSENPYFYDILVTSKTPILLRPKVFFF